MLHHPIEENAVTLLEYIRWGDNPQCPHCENFNVYKMRDDKTGFRERNFRWRCRGCKKQFTVRIGTFMEDSRIDCYTWLLAFQFAARPEGVTALDIWGETGTSLKSCYFIMQRMRFALDEAA